MATKTIVLFNHKGGVSKTISTFNIGWKLTQYDKKVLFVDGDPQCNLSSLLMADDFEDYYIDDATKTKNIKDGVKMAFEGKPSPIEPFDCYRTKNNENLFLIPGHMDLSEYEPSLSLALNSNNAISTLQNLPGSFYELIKLCCVRHNIDYVFIDMNPGLGALNQTFFMYSDAIIIPTNPDPFSLMALNTLKTILPRWKKWAMNSRQLFQHASYPLPAVEMKFVGIIIQRFNIRNKKAARPYQGIMNDIKKAIEEEFVPELAKVSMAYDIDSLIELGVIQNHCLAEISDFGALLQRANEANVPVFCLTEEHLKASGSALGSMKTSRDRFDEIFDNIAKVILELVI